MKREDVEAIIGTGADKDVVTKLLDAMHAEITPYDQAGNSSFCCLSAANSGDSVSASVACSSNSR